MNPAKLAWFRTIGYDPHSGQRLFHNSAARFRVAMCGRRYGKSLMAARDREPELLRPHSRGWIAGPQYSLGEKEFRVFWDDLIIGQQFGKDPRVLKAYSVKQGNMYIELPNRARVEVVSSDHPNSLVGEGLDWMIVSEAAKHSDDVWEKYLRPALADKRGSADLTSTPEGQNWFYRFWQLGQGRDQMFESWHFPSWENTKVFPGGRNDPEILAAERTTGREYFDQEYGAEPTSFVGKIFTAFDEAKHVRPVNFNPAWPSYICFDPGFTNPFAAIEFQVSPGDSIYVWREYYDTGKTVGMHIAELRRRENPPHYHLDLGFSDAADPEAALTLTQNFVPTIAMPEAKANWREGVDLVASFLDEVETGDVVDEYGTPEKVVRFFVDPKCQRFIHEMANYRRRKPPATGTDPQDGPLKKDDHGVDGIRYGLMHLFKLGMGAHMSDIAAANPHLFVAQPVIQIREPSMAMAGDPMDALAGVYGTADTIFHFGDDDVF
jgi:hypothetical protein